MSANESGLEDLVLTQLMRLNAIFSGIITGTIAGSFVFIATILLVMKGGDVVGPHLSLLGEFFPGYEVSFGGSLVGLAYGLLGGFLVGYFVARMYNWLVELRDGRGAKARELPPPTGRLSS